MRLSKTVYPQCYRIVLHTVPSYCCTRCPGHRCAGDRHRSSNGPGERRRTHPPCDRRTWDDWARPQDEAGHTELAHEGARRHGVSEGKGVTGQVTCASRTVGVMKMAARCVTTTLMTSSAVDFVSCTVGGLSHRNPGVHVLPGWVTGGSAGCCTV